MKPEEDGGEFEGVGDQRRCSACYKWARKHGGGNRPVDLVIKSAKGSD
jgi:hypothetical protein